MPNQDNLYNFTRLPCAQQPQSNQQYGPYPFPNNGYNTQGQNMYDIMYGTQSRNQVTHPQTTPNIYDHIDPSWLPDARMVNDLEKGLKFADKIETIEISSKDLSPASCCSNIDLLLPDFYKNVNNKVTDTQLYNSFYNTNYNKNYIEYPSCSQINCDENNFEKTVKYCSIQKSNYFDGTIKSYDNIITDKHYDTTNRNYDNITNKNYDIQNKFGLTNKNFNYNNDLICNQYNIQQDLFNQFETKIQDNSLINITDVFPTTQEICSEGLPFDNLTSLDQRTEGTNEDSDIIVEESDDGETTDYCEDTERRYDYTTNCMVCDSVYSPSGNQFYILTSETPLTMSSQKPVYKKLIDMVGVVSIKRNYLCSQCLSLINTIDHLQFKLDNCKFELSTKYEKTNNITNDTIKSMVVKKLYVKCKHKFNCRLCRKVFSMQNVYKNHIARHKSLNRFLCEVCGKRFTKVAAFKIHLKVNCIGGKLKNIKIKAFLCKICMKPFRTKSNLKEHETYCSGKLPFKCKSCNKKFATTTKLKNHIKLKHDKKFTSICSICNIGFIQMSNYKAHMITHSTDKKFNCTKCEKSYKTLTNLKFHMKFHKDKLPFICTICSKGFMRKEYLEAHINLHKGLKNFVCTICNKKFIAQKNLDAHMKHHDGNIKKKSCNICGKLIATGLEDHLRTHTNLKEFECEKCEMRFNTKGAFFKHKKRKHGDSS